MATKRSKRVKDRERTPAADAAKDPAPTGTTELEDLLDGDAKTSSKSRASRDRASRASAAADPQGGTAKNRRAAKDEARSSTRRRVAAEAPNPAWLAPTAVVFLIAGLLYLVVYYISSAQLPLPIGDWNLAAGFGLLMLGGGMLMFWK